MEQHKIHAQDFLRTIPPNARRNYYLNIALIRADIVLAFTMIVFFMTILHSGVPLILPIVLFIASTFGLWIRTNFTPGSPLRPLPPDINARIGALIDLPKRTIFRRGSGNDCTSVSLYFLHIIFLPQGFETDLENPNKRAILLHELSHERFFDYLALFWIIFTFGLFSYALLFLAVEYLGYMQSIDLSWERMPRNVLYASMFPFAVLVVLTMFNGIGIFHRKEHNADFGAYLQAPETYSNFLRNRIAKLKYYKYDRFNIFAKFMNKLYHPSFKKRLDFLTGEIKINQFGVIIPSIIFGFCPGYVIFSCAVGLTTFVQHTTMASILSIPFGLICIIYCGLFLKDVFERKSPTTFIEKMLIWSFMLLGTQLLFIAYITTFRITYDAPELMLSVPIEQLDNEIRITTFSIFFGYLQFALYLWACSKYLSTFFAGVIALIIFMFVGYIVYYTFSAIGGINYQTDSIFVLIMFFVPVGLVILVEYFIQALIKLLAPAKLGQLKQGV